LHAKCKRLNDSFEHSSPQFLLEYCLTFEFTEQIALVSSFGTEAAILLHIVSQVKPDLDVLFINTGKLFPQTLDYKQDLVSKFGLSNVLELSADPKLVAQADPNGDLWSRNYVGCCGVRKVAPNENAIVNYKAWISGRKRYQGGARANLRKFELKDGKIKINPLASWGRQQIKAYYKANDIPNHPLLKEGYLSVGCHHCSKPSFDPNDPRAGRWNGAEKTECGIHS